MRIRASLGALPSGAPLLLDSQSINNKENPSTSRDSAPPAPLGEAVTAPSTTQNRKKRAQSLGGDALGGATKRSRTVEALRRDSTFAFELSPGKLERRRAVSSLSPSAIPVNTR